MNNDNESMNNDAIDISECVPNVNFSIDAGLDGNLLKDDKNNCKKFGNNCKNNDNGNKFNIGDIVFVQARTWPGINKLGGMGRISKINVGNTYNVQYILGGSEKSVKPKYIRKETIDIINVKHRVPKEREFFSDYDQSKQAIALKKADLFYEHRGRKAKRNNSPSSSNTNNKNNNSNNFKNTIDDDMQSIYSERNGTKKQKLMIINENSSNSISPADKLLLINKNNMLLNGLNSIIKEIPNDTNLDYISKVVVEEPILSQIAIEKVPMVIKSDPKPIIPTEIASTPLIQGYKNNVQSPSNNSTNFMENIQTIKQGIDYQNLLKKHLQEKLDMKQRFDCEYNYLLQKFICQISPDNLLDNVIKQDISNQVSIVSYY